MFCMPLKGDLTILHGPKGISLFYMSLRGVLWTRPAKTKHCTVVPERDSLWMECMDGMYELALFLFLPPSPKIQVGLLKAKPSKPSGPAVLEKASYIRLSFRKGGQQEVT